MAIKEREMVEVALSDLNPAAYNPREISEEALAGLRASMDRFGDVQPIVWNRRSKNVVGGHQRLKVYQKAGREEVQVVVVDMDELKEKAANISLNSPMLEGQFTQGIVPLVEELKVELPSLAENLRLEELVGSLTFEPVEGGGDGEGGGADEEVIDKSAEFQAKWACAPGQLWEIPSKTVGGKSHRIICGDSTDPMITSRVLRGEKPALCATDPPYGVEYNPAWRDEAQKDGAITIGGRVRTGRVRTAQVANDDRVDWADALGLSGADIVYVWHAALKTRESADMVEKAGFTIRQEVIWNKSQGVLSRSRYHWKHEGCWYGVRPGATDNWQGGFDKTTVWDIPVVMRRVEGDTDHPTQKPIEIFARSIRHHTQPGQMVYEPFSGSGSQLVAAEQEGRLCCAVELDPRYVATALERLANLGLEPRLAEFPDGDQADVPAGPLGDPNAVVDRSAPATVTSPVLTVSTLPAPDGVSEAPKEGSNQVQAGLKPAPKKTNQAGSGPKKGKKGSKKGGK